MGSAAATQAQAPVSPARGTAGRARSGLVARQIRRGALIVGVVSAGMPAVVAGQYRTTVAGEFDGPALQALAANPAIRTLFGPPLALDDAGGFTVWRTGTPLAVLLAVWAALVTTRVLRGEEETGRWALLLAGPGRARDLMVGHLVVLGSAVLSVGVAAGLGLASAGTSPTGAALFAAGLALVGLVSVGLAALTSQLFSTRSAAATAAVGVVLATLLVRMIGDGVGALSWLAWVTPFGLLAGLRPFAGDHPAPLLPLAVMALCSMALAVAGSARRDVGSALLPARHRRRPRTRLLGSVEGFAVRRGLAPWIGWMSAVVAYFLLIGGLAVSVTEFLDDNRRFAALAAAAGFSELSSVDGYAATMFALLGVPTGVYAAARISAFVGDERDGRAVLLFAQPVSRLRLLGAEAGTVVAGIVTILVLAGCGLWSGAVIGGAEFGIGPAVGGALATAPIALLCLGAALLAAGWAPPVVLVVGSLPAVGGFLLQVVGQSVGAPGWLIGISPFAHLAAVPAEAADWASLGTLSGVAVACAGIGAVGYSVRDLVR
jgi:ABC-2 type transport system permease protein